MTNRLTIAVILFVMTPFSSAFSAAQPKADKGLVLVRNGQPAATIVIAREAVANDDELSGYARMWVRNRVSTADVAKELQQCIQKVSGAELPILTDDQPVRGPLILLGESSYTRKLGLTNSSFKPQEYLIRTMGNNLILMGYYQSYADWTRNHPNDPLCWSSLGQTSPMGTFQPIGNHYAVYAFLERFCGIRWYLPDEIGEVVPKHKTIEIPKTDIRVIPSTRHRSVCPDAVPKDWFWKPSINTPPEGVAPSQWWWENMMATDTVYAWGRRLKLSGEPFVCNHSLYGYYDRFAKEHPDWWPNSQPKPGAQLCYSNPELVEQVAQDARDYFDGKGAGGIGVGDSFSVVPMDNDDFCQCPTCKAQRKDAGIRDSDYVWGFIAKVAEEVKKTHRGKKIACVSYRTYNLAPDPTKVKLPDNVVVQICPGFDAFTSPSADYHEKWFAGWAKQVNPSNVYIWWYWQWPTNPSNQSFPNVSPKAVGDLVRAMNRYGFSGGAMAQIDESHGTTWSYPVLDHIRVYVFAKMLEDWDADEKQIVDEYYKLFYGSAQKPMRKFWEYINTRQYDKTRMTPVWQGKQSQDPKFDWTILCPPADLESLGKDLDEARTLVPADSIYRKRIDLVDNAVYQGYLVRASNEVLGKK